LGPRAQPGPRPGRSARRQSLYRAAPCSGYARGDRAAPRHGRPDRCLMNLLLVEDDERVRRFVVRGLQAEGHAVTLACDGVDGFERASSEDYDVLVLDVMLPRLDGRQLCARLRDANLCTPILMLTALDQVE